MRKSGYQASLVSTDRQLEITLPIKAVDDFEAAELSLTRAKLIFPDRKFVVYGIDKLAANNRWQLVPQGAQQYLVRLNTRFAEEEYLDNTKY